MSEAGSRMRCVGHTRTRRRQCAARVALQLCDLLHVLADHLTDVQLTSTSGISREKQEPVGVWYMPAPSPHANTTRATAAAYFS